MQKTILFSILLLALGSASAAPPPSVTLGEEDSGKSVAVQKGAQLTLVLPQNRTTGYSWQLLSSGEPGLRQVGEPKETTESDRPGSGGKISYRFEAVAEGTSALELAYRRPWEKEAPPAKSFRAKVTVTK